MLSRYTSIRTGTIGTTQDTTKYRTSFSKNFESNWWEPGFDDSAWQAVWPIAYGTDVWTNDDVNGPPTKVRLLLSELSIQYQ